MNRVFPLNHQNSLGNNQSEESVVTNVIGNQSTFPETSQIFNKRDINPFDDSLVRSPKETGFNTPTPRNRFNPPGRRLRRGDTGNLEDTSRDVNNESYHQNFERHAAIFIRENSGELTLREQDSQRNLIPPVIDEEPERNNEHQNPPEEAQNHQIPIPISTVTVPQTEERESFTFDEAIQYLETNLSTQVVTSMSVNMRIFLMSLLSSFLGLLVLKGFLNYILAFSLVWFFCAFRSLFIMVTIKKEKNLSPSSKKENFVELVELLFLILFLAVASFKISNYSATLLPIPCLGLPFTIIASLLCTNQPQKIFLQNKLPLILKFLSWIQALFLALKGDDILSDWNVVFIFPLCILGIITAYLIGKIATSISFVSQFSQTPNFKGLVIGFLWESLGWLGGFPLGFLLFALTRYYSRGDEEILFRAILAFFAYSTCLVFMTMCWTTSIERYLFVSVFFTEKAKIEKAKYEQQFELIDDYDQTAYLMKVSNAFFLDSTKELEIFKIKDKQKIKAWKERICNCREKNKTSRDITKRRKSIDLLRHPETSHQSQFSSSLSLNDIDILDDIKRPESENETDDKQCVICFSVEPDSVFMECGHGGVCYSCALKAWKKDENCFLCRKPIEKLLKVQNFSQIDIAKVTLATKKNLFIYHF